MLEASGDPGAPAKSRRSRGGRNKRHDVPAGYRVAEIYFERRGGRSIVGNIYKGRVDNPYWKSDPNFEAIVQNILRSVPVGHPGPITPAAVEVQAQHILTDMAGRVVTAGLSPEAALKEAHARVEEIYKVRRT